MIARYTMTNYDKQLEAEVCAWFEANGIQPTGVPKEAEVVIADGQITYEWRERGEVGRVRRAAPLLVPMPPELDKRADWRLPARLCDRCQADLEETR